jgi:hypothetical protein
MFWEYFLCLVISIAIICCLSLLVMTSIGSADLYDFAVVDMTAKWNSAALEKMPRGARVLDIVS